MLMMVNAGEYWLYNKIQNKASANFVEPFGTGNRHEPLSDGRSTRETVSQKHLSQNPVRGVHPCTSMMSSNLGLMGMWNLKRISAESIFACDCVSVWLQSRALRDGKLYHLSLLEIPNVQMTLLGDTCTVNQLQWKLNRLMVRLRTESPAQPHEMCSCTNSSTPKR